MTNEVTKTKNTAISVETYADFEGLQTGFEGLTSNDILMPRISVLQQLSPQVNKTKPEFIAGAEAGDFCDVGAGEVFKESITIIPCYYARIFLEWAPRASGKGLVKNHGKDDSILLKATKNDKGQMVLPNGNYIVETATWFVLNLTAGGRKSFIPLSSTQLKASRKWMTQLTSERIKRADGTEFQPPMFYRAWTATPVVQSNNQGEWHGWRFSPAQNILEIDPSKSLLADAKAFYAQGVAGELNGDLRDVEESQTETENSPM